MFPIQLSTHNLAKLFSLQLFQNHRGPLNWMFKGNGVTMSMDLCMVHQYPVERVFAKFSSFGT